MAQNEQDTELKELVEKIQQFLSHQIENNSSLNDAAKESLFVATECIEQAYNIQKRPASQELAKIYKSHKQQQLSGGQQQTGNPVDPAALLSNLAGSIFSQVGGGLMGAATGAAAAASAAAAAAGQQQQHQSNTHTTTSSQSHSTSVSSSASAPTQPPRQRKRASEAEKMAAESFKNQGNDCMKQDKHREAIDYYTQAIDIDDNNAIYYSNRAAAHSKLANHEAALRDCQEAIEIDPNYSKAYGRMGLAYASLDNHSEAKKAYVKAVELDPSNESYQNNLNIAEEKLAEQQGGGVAGAGQAGANAGANVAGMLRSMMSNPQVMSMAMQSLQDPRIQTMFGLGANAGGAGNGTAGGNAQQQQANRNEPQTNHEQTTESGNQNAGSHTTSSSTTTTNQSNQDAEGQQQAPSFNPADLLNLTSRIAGNANIDIVGAGQQLLSSIQQNNPDLVDNMRRMMSQALLNLNDGPGGANQDDRNPPPGYS